MLRASHLSSKLLLWVALCAIAAVTVVRPQRAAACSRAPGGGPYSDLPQSGSDLPANLLQWVTSGGPDASYKVVAVEPDGTERNVRFESSAIDPFDGPRLYLGLRRYQVTEPLTVGTELRLVFEDEDNGQQRTVLTYKVAAAASLAASQTLGEIRAEPQVGTLRIGGSYLGECHIDAKDASYARIQLQPAEELLPFEALLRYELRIDDERSWTYDDGQQAEERLWTSSLGAGADIVYVLCHGEVSKDAGPAANGLSPEWRERLREQRQVLEPGEHTVRMVGRLPDGRELVSNELVVDLTCSHIEPAPSHEQAGALLEADAHEDHEDRVAQAVPTGETRGAATAQPTPDTAGGCGFMRNARGAGCTLTLLLWSALGLLYQRRRYARASKAH